MATVASRVFCWSGHLLKPFTKSANCESENPSRLPSRATTAPAMATVASRVFCSSGHLLKPFTKSANCESENPSRLPSQATTAPAMATVASRVSCWSGHLLKPFTKSANCESENPSRLPSQATTAPAMASVASRVFCWSDIASKMRCGPPSLSGRPACPTNSPVRPIFPLRSSKTHRLKPVDNRHHWFECGHASLQRHA
ncbi:hypothetical protein [Bradyrhizobium sp. 191]|uniref:hypothetical protein n=1 Tax=Bradyrhizobium sp. 191 TaxID=2782659 RepID=UPI001FFF3AD1|nr:hypothetical protein [Bradyrhizobium sp. 191]